MNTWQCIQQVEYNLKNHVWEGSATKVFPTGSALITQTDPRAMISDIRLPAVFIGISSEQPDPRHQELPDLIHQEVVVALVVDVPGPAGEFGRAGLIGRCRASQTESGGRGLLEVEEEVFRAIKLLNDADGVKIIWFHSSAPEPEVHDTHKNIIWRGYRWRLETSATRYYQDATNLALTESSGTVTATWTLQPDRWDRYSVALRYASGSTAPTSVTGGTGVTLVGNLPTTGAQAGLVAGTYSFALFSGYDENGDGSVDRWSDGTTATITFT